MIKVQIQQSIKCSLYNLVLRIMRTIQYLNRCKTYYDTIECFSGLLSGTDPRWDAKLHGKWGEMEWEVKVRLVKSEDTCTPLRFASFLRCKFLRSVETVLDNTLHDKCFIILKEKAWDPQMELTYKYLHMIVEYLMWFSQ